MEAHQISNAVITDIAGSPDGQFVAATDKSGVFWLEAKTMKTIHAIKTGKPAECIAFSPDSQSACVGVHGGEVLIVRVDSREVKKIKTKAPGFSSVTWSPDGGLLCLGQYEPSLTLIDTESWKSKSLDPDNYDDSGRTKVLFASNGKAILSTAGNQVLLWEEKDGGYVPEKVLDSGRYGHFTDLLVTPDKTLIAVEEIEQQCYLYSWAIQSDQKPVKTKLPDYFSRIAWAEKHHCIAVAEFPGTKIIYRKPGDLTEPDYEPPNVGEHTIACLSADPKDDFLWIGTRGGIILH